MKQLRWDKELAKLATNITQIEQQVALSLTAERIKLLQKKQAIHQYQLAVEKQIDKFLRLAKSRHHLPQKLMATIHWGHVISEKIQKLYERKCTIWGMSMWQNLIKTRLIGNPSIAPLYVGDNDLVAMSNRHNMLRVAETQLSASLIACHEQKKKLELEKRQVNTMLSNLDAALSLQGNWLENSRHLSNNPIYRTMKSYIKWLTLPLRVGNHPGEQKLQDDYEEAVQKTQNILNYCHERVINEAENCDHSSNNLPKNVEDELTRIDKLHASMERLVEQSLDKKPPVAHPKITHERQDATY